MRLGGKSSDGHSYVVEIIHATYDLVDPELDKGSDLVNLKMLDTQSNHWYLDNILKVDAESILYGLTRWGHAYTDTIQALRFEAVNQDVEDGEDIDEI